MYFSFVIYCRFTCWLGRERFVIKNARMISVAADQQNQPHSILIIKIGTRSFTWESER